MIDNIIHCSEEQSFNILKQFPKEDIQDTFLISISEDPSVHQKHRESNWADVLCLDFADTDDWMNEKAFVTSVHAFQIYQFVKKIEQLPKRHSLLIHCYMGVYRSNAVAHAIADHFGWGWSGREIVVQNLIGLRQPVKQSFVYSRCLNGFIAQECDYD